MKFFIKLYILILLKFYKCAIAIASENPDLIQQVDEKGNLIEHSEQKSGEKMIAKRTLDGALIVTFESGEERSKDNKSKEILKYKNSDKKQNSSNKKMWGSCCSCI